MIYLSSHNKNTFFHKCLGVIDYNFLCFRNGIQQVFELRNKSLAAVSANNHSTSPVSISESTNMPTTVTQTGQNGTIVLAQS